MTNFDRLCFPEGVKSISQVGMSRGIKSLSVMEGLKYGH